MKKKNQRGEAVDPSFVLIKAVIDVVGHRMVCDLANGSPGFWFHATCNAQLETRGEELAEWVRIFREEKVFAPDNPRFKWPAPIITLFTAAGAHCDALAAMEARMTAKESVEKTNDICDRVGTTLEAMTQALRAA